MMVVRKFSFAFSLIVVTNFGVRRKKFNVPKIYMLVCMDVSGTCCDSVCV
jgi:hypothetical protein